MKYRTQILPNVFLTSVQTDKFKTGCFSLNLLRPLCRGEASANALIPSVLLRGSKQYPDIRSISARLDELYGASMAVLIGQIFGRWGNFFNREAHGAVTDSFFKMGLVDATGTVVYYHPTFLYESVWNLIGFIALHFYQKKRKFDGELFLLYIAWYGLGRTWIEGLRTDSLYLFNTGIRVSQLLAAVSCVAAVGILLYVYLKKNPNGENLYVRKAARKAEADEQSKAEDDREQ